MSWSDVLLAADERPLEPGTGIVVLVTLYGGNDGLNTYIPYADNAYHDARNELAYAPDEVIRLDDQYGLNPGLRTLGQQFDEGSLAIVRGVGYPKPDRSHFRSMDIWQSASLDNSVSTGWIGRWLDDNGSDPLLALHMGSTLPALAVGDTCSAAVFANAKLPSASWTEFMTTLSSPTTGDSAATRMVCDSYRDAVAVNERMAPLFRKDGRPRLVLENELSSQLDIVAACIEADVPTQVYSVALGGFDTHADERDTQEDLLSSLDRALSRFFKKVSQGKRAKDITVMAYSEFGRRVAANASDGTDHGTAGTLFVAGNRVAGGIYGDAPSLTDLVDDDLKVTTDFRDVYHEILAHGLDSDPEPVLGKGRKEIGFFKA